MAEKRETVYNPAADRRWAQKNPEHKKYLRNRSSARSFIRKDATDEDLTELKELIALREACYPQKLDNDNNPTEE